MAETFKIKSGDLLPGIEIICTDGNGNVVDLTVATAVRFHMRPRGAKATDDPLIDEAAEFVDKPTGHVRYLWTDGDTDTPGLYKAEFEVTSAGKPVTFPNDDDIPVHIRRAVG